MKAAVAALFVSIIILWWVFYDMPDKQKETNEKLAKLENRVSDLEKRVGKG